MTICISLAFSCDGDISELIDIFYENNPTNSTLHISLSASFSR